MWCTTGIFAFSWRDFFLQTKYWADALCSISLHMLFCLHRETLGKWWLWNFNSSHCAEPTSETQQCSPFSWSISSHLCALCLQELQTQLTQRADQYHRLLDQGESMLLARGGEEAGPGTTQTQQNLSMLQNKWASLNTKMDDRRVRLWHIYYYSVLFCSWLNYPCLWILIYPESSLLLRYLLVLIGLSNSELSRQSWMRLFPWQRVSRPLCRTPSTGWPRLNRHWTWPNPQASFWTLSCSRSMSTRYWTCSRY